MRSAKSGLEYIERKTGRKRKAHAVLFALCQQLTCDTNSDSSKMDACEETEEATDKEMLHALTEDFEDEMNSEGLDKKKTYFW